MWGRGRGLSRAAVTVVNALATGLGAALGIDMKAEAEAELIDAPGEVVVESDVREGEGLVRESAMEVLRAYGAEKAHGVRVAVRSEVPVARGLKSSSAVSNAVVLAVARALGVELPSERALEMAVEASIRAGVTVTGALDDAAASLLGGLVVTDNYGRRLVRRYSVEGLKVVLLIPPSRRYTSRVEAEMLRAYSSLLRLAWSEALAGRWEEAMNLNGLVVSSALGYPTQPLVEALRRGARAASPSGKGPALSAVVPEDRVDEVARLWSSMEGEVRVVEVFNGEGRG